VNATSVGLKTTDGLAHPQLKFHQGQIAYDVVYHHETEFLKNARAEGATAADGLNMLVYQGAKAFELWTGAPAPIEIMRLALQQALKKV
jgi:shikimate dehydrogenase